MKRVGWIGLILVAVLQVLESRAMRPGLVAQMSAEELHRTGLYKLNDNEAAALEAWVDLHRPACPPAQPVGDSSMVTFNTSSHRYHCPSCRGARQCTRNCISLSKAEAIERDGVPCRMCGGSCN